LITSSAKRRKEKANEYPKANTQRERRLSLSGRASNDSRERRLPTGDFPEMETATRRQDAGAPGPSQLDVLCSLFNVQCSQLIFIFRKDTL
jgi:hypothetical protein